ncbi:MAG TPA: hypothetical protein VNK44_08335 [Candidatus Nitrosotenuis sp.]|nr:hypothetical protein [Candidatus Nitrosotenuis sp.]
MQTKDLVDKLTLADYPVALGGCKAHKTTLDCCEHNITVFDGTNQKDLICWVDDIMVRIHHGTLGESNSNILQKYENMVILTDNDWSLRIFQSKLKEKEEKIRASTIKECLVDAVYYTTKAKQGLGTDPFAAVWLKCAAYLVCDALVLLNSKMRSPTHMLEFIRKSEKSRVNESFSKVAEIIGLERATTSLLERMVKSTIGFSDMIEENGHSQIIQKKYEYLVNNSLLSDCYFYLGYVNKTNVFSISKTIHKRPDLTHILKIGLDLEHDQTKIEQQTRTLHKLANEMSATVQNYA